MRTISSAPPAQAAYRISPPAHLAARRSVRAVVSGLGWSLGLVCALWSTPSWANDAPAAPPVVKGKAPVAGEITATSASSPKEVGNQIREALGTSVAPNKKLMVTINSTDAHASAPPSAAAVAANRESRAARLAAMQAAKEKAEPKADAHAGEVHWSYEGENGPAQWGSLKPDFHLCAAGKRQSPINIQESTSLAGPAEPLQFNYAPSNASVVNNGHTIQVNVEGDNSITVRGTRYQLLQFHFHNPSEEQINFKRFPMVAHLVHKNDAGQLAVVAVLLEQGMLNPLIDKVWTYMPLDAGDKVNMPNESLNLTELLPTEQRYYQFMGSLTTPPCSENVLWMVLKTPVQISKAQHRLFNQLYPMNARPVQALNGRPVRDAQ